VGRGPIPHMSVAWSARRAATVVAVVAGLAGALLAILANGQTDAQAVPAAHAAGQVSLLGQHKVMRRSQRTPAGRLSAFRFVASATGTAHAAHVYVGRGSDARSVIVALYANRRGHPGRLLVSATIAHPRPGWRRAGLHAHAVKTGSVYWLGLLGSGGAVVDRVRTGSRCRSPMDAQRGLKRAPAAWRAGRNRGVCAVSAFITGTRAASKPPGGGSGSATGTWTGTGTPSGTGTATTPTIPANGCFASPGACGLPDPSVHNVGATSACSSLTSSGTVTANKPGQTVSNLNINGRLLVSAPNVTISNVCVSYDGGGQLNTSALYIQGSAANTVLQHVTVGGANTSTQSAEQAITNASNGNATATAVYAYNCGECVWGGPWTLNDSYVITNGMQGTDDHLEDVYYSDESISMNHDTLLNPDSQNSVTFGDTHFHNGGPCDNHITITNSLLAGGGFVIYTCGNASGVGSSTMNISNDRFARCTTPPFRYNSGSGGTACQNSSGSSIGSGADAHGYWPKSGYFGTLLSGYCPPTSGQTWSGNVYDDSGAAVPCHIGSP
jgi:hypothetical protein